MRRLESKTAIVCGRDGGIASYFPYFPGMRTVFDNAVEAKRAAVERDGV